jgi:hypothetical protein
VIALEEGGDELVATFLLKIVSRPKRAEPFGNGDKIAARPAVEQCLASLVAQMRVRDGVEFVEERRQELGWNLVRPLEKKGLSAGRVGFVKKGAKVASEFFAFGGVFGECVGCGGKR